jgi:hypothetical protein
MLLDALPDLADLELRPWVPQRCTCLIIKPPVNSAADRETQKGAIKVIKDAIREAGFCPADKHQDGLVLSDLSHHLIQEVDRADLVIVDANAYDLNATRGVGLACLYYLLAMLHSQDHSVLLVARSKDHLPFHLQASAATLDYPTDYVSMETFFEKFKDTAAKLLQGESDVDTNPIQRYRKEMVWKEQERRIQATETANAAQQALIAELQREIERLSQAEHGRDHLPPTKPVGDSINPSPLDDKGSPRARFRPRYR